MEGAAGSSSAAAMAPIASGRLKPITNLERTYDLRMSVRRSRGRTRFWQLLPRLLAMRISNKLLSLWCRCRSGVWCCESAAGCGRLLWPKEALEPCSCPEASRWRSHVYGSTLVRILFWKGFLLNHDSLQRGDAQGLLEVCPSKPGLLAAATVLCAGTALHPCRPSLPSLPPLAI